MASWTAYVVAALVAVPAVLLGLDRAVQPRDWSDASIFYPERFHGPEVSAAGWYFEGCEGSYPNSTFPPSRWLPRLPTCLLLLPLRFTLQIYFPSMSTTDIYDWNCDPQGTSSWSPRTLALQSVSSQAYFLA